MTSNKRRKHRPEFKAAMALELLTGRATVAQLAKKHQLKESMLYEWKREAIEKLALVFTQRMPGDAVDQRVEELERLIGQQAVKIAALKKASKWLSRASRSSEPS
jgi:transposase